MMAPGPDRIPDSLWSAYEDTLFVFRDGEAIGQLRVGRPPDAVVSALLRRNGAQSVAFLTAYNPQHGPDQVAARNLERQASLRAELDRRGLVYLPGAGLGRDARWDPEASLLVLGLSEADAVVLGRRFGQNAVVWCQEGLPAKLLESR